MKIITRDRKEILITDEQAKAIAVQINQGVKMIHIPSVNVYINPQDIMRMEKGIEPPKKIENRIEARHQQTEEEFLKQRKKMEEIRQRFKK